MKRNENCMRDIMLYLEENLIINNRASVEICDNTIIKALQDVYREDDICYSLHLLTENGFLVTSPVNHALSVYGFTSIKDITSRGHDFLDNVRKQVKQNN